MKLWLVLFCIIISLNSGFAQKISLDSCLNMARNNYPMIKQLELLDKIEGFNIKNINATWLPNLSGTAQASIQSDVTSIKISIPGFPAIEPPNKDQYKFFIDAGQLLFDGGATKQQKIISRLQSQSDKLKVESELYKLKDKVINLYFGILLLQEQINILNFSKKDIEGLLKKTKNAYEAKVVSGYQLNSVLAESEKLDQRALELSYQMTNLTQSLSLLTNKNITDKNEFIVPVKVNINTTLNRPEINLLTLQEQLIDHQYKWSTTMAIPKLVAFAQGGYANPALNFLKNEFNTYYVAGLRLNWNISSLYNLNRSKNISLINKSISQLNIETLEFNIHLSRIQQDELTKKFEMLVLSDQRLIVLNSKIKDASKLQYENGTITLNDYLKDLDAEEQSKTNELIHKLSYLQSIILINNLYGN
ncbi:MAG: TolC family protein [Saprospiraceae bacterium]